MFDISQLVVIGAILVPFWLCVVIPLALTILIFISIGKGIAYLFRRDLYERINKLHEVVYQKDKKISTLHLREQRLSSFIDELNREIKGMRSAHELDLAKVKFNVGNTGIFTNLPALSVVTELPAESSAKPPPLPPRRSPPRPAPRQQRLQS